MGSGSIARTMARSMRQIIRSMELEEKILNGAAIVGALSVFLPWLSGEWLGGPIEHYSGFGFFHTFLGLAVFLLHLCMLALALLPAFGVRLPWTRRQREHIRFTMALLATAIALGALSVLAQLTFESTRMDIRFGVYVAIVAGIVTAFYAWLRLQEVLRSESGDHFGHPEDPDVPPRRHPEEKSFTPPPPPPPPPPMPPEDHRMHR